MIERAEDLVRSLGAVGVVVAWVAAGVGASRAARRAPGRATGLARRLGALGAYAVGALPYVLVAIALWRPLPLELSDTARWWALGIGTVVGAAGLGAYLWGRFALGDMYNVSSSLGSELFRGHRLVRAGPYRWVRHPMYLGLILGGLGALLVYRTWSTLFIVLALPGVVVKARAEDRLLATELGPAFEVYRASTPAWIPLPRRRRTMPTSPATPAATG